MNTAQTQAAKAKLDIDLATADTDRLIELCLLYRANPKASDTFPARLKSELERRFTAQEIAREDTMFAVLQHFANQFQSAIPMLAVKLREMAATVNRDIWFADNKALFVSALNDREVMQWLVKEHDILEKVLNNQIALPLVAQSEAAATVILTDPDALALWKNARNLWAVWPQHAQGMAVLAKSAELVQYVIDDTARLNAVAASAVAMNAVAAQEIALRAIVGQETARNALIAHNDKLQAVRETMYNTVKDKWTKVRTVRLQEPSSGVRYVVNNAQIKSASANTLVFADITSYHNRTDTSSGQLEHPNGQVAATGGGEPMSTVIKNVDGVSFGGAQVKQLVQYIDGAADIFTPN